QQAQVGRDGLVPVADRVGLAGEPLRVVGERTEHAPVVTGVSNAGQCGRPLPGVHRVPGLCWPRTLVGWVVPREVNGDLDCAREGRGPVLAPGLLAAVLAYAFLDPFQAVEQQR